MSQRNASEVGLMTDAAPDVLEQWEGRWRLRPAKTMTKAEFEERALRYGCTVSPTAFTPEAVAHAASCGLILEKVPA